MLFLLSVTLKHNENKIKYLHKPEFTFIQAEKGENYIENIKNMNKIEIQDGWQKQSDCI